MLWRGTILAGRYEITGLVGKGGMGSVYLATDHRINGRQVAVKANLQTDKRALDQFEAEVRVLAALRHPGLPAITDYFTEPDGRQYLVMDYVDGDTLEDIVERRGPLSEVEVMAFATAVLEIIEYLHAKGVIHRDIKPANIKRTNDDKLFLVDFGIAKISIAQEATITGYAIKGLASPGFAPLEQYVGSTDSRSDIYSFGAVLYYLLSGQVPPQALELAGGSVLAPPSQIQAGITSDFDRLVIRAMATNPADRFQSAAEMRQALLQVSSRPMRKVAHLIFIGVGVLASLWGVWHLLPRIVPGFEGWLSLIAAYREWIIPAMIASLFVLICIVAIVLVRKRTSKTVHLVQRARTSLDAETPDPTSSYRTARMSATDLRPKLDDWVKGGNRKVIEELILHEDFESLKTWIANASGERWLLTGYGRFGGTSLVKGAIQRATRELQAQRNGNILVLHFDVDESEDQVESFEVRANEIYLGTLTSLSQQAIPEDKRTDGTLTETTKSSRTFHFKLTQSIDRSFFNWTPSVDQLLRKHRYDFSELVADLQSLTESNKSPSDLRKITARLLGSDELPSRVVVILDRVSHLETLEELSRSILFSSENMSVIAVARKEEVGLWTNSAERLKSIDFREWVISCMWSPDLVSKAVSVLMQSFGNPTASAERNLSVLCGHLAYIGRGSLGKVLEELRPNERPWYWKTDNKGEYFLQLDPLPHASELEHNAWKQEMLQKNWGTILPRHLSGTHPLRDQARIGVYYLMDWIDGKTSFNFDELRAAAETTPITISIDDSIRTEVVTRLIYVLKANAYLRLMDGRYVVQWSDPRLREPRQIRFRRAKSNITVEQQQVRFRRDSLHLDIIIEEVTDTSTPSAKMEKQQMPRQIKILTVFANPNGSDKGRLDEEERTIKECVAQCQQRDNLHLKSIPAARIRDLQLALMTDDYQVVHFSSYATETGELQFEDDKGEAKPVPKEALANLLRLYSSIECVILNARHTLSQGQLIASGVTCTIAMDGPISHEASRFFVRGFYDAVGSGKTYAEAFQQGRVALGLEGFSSEEIVVPKLLDQSSGRS